jgi:hypothetical protein
VGAHRVFIRPNNATGVVASVSRTEIFGGGGLESFVLADVRPGMFGHPHAALGSMKFVASNGVLRVNNLEPLAEDGNGTLIQFNNATTADVQLLPLDIALANTNEIQERLEITCSGTRAYYDRFISSTRLQNTNGLLHLSTYRDDALLTDVAFYSNGVLVATQTISITDVISILGAPRLVAIGAKADTLSGPAGLSLGFDALATFEIADLSVSANRVTLTAESFAEVADIRGLGILARVLPSFAISGESSISTVPQVSITRSNDFVILRWADPAAAYLVQARPPLSDDPWNTYDPSAIVRTNGMATFTYGAIGSESPPAQFFRLLRYSYND